MSMMWYMKKNRCVQSFKAICVAGKSLKSPILCFHRVEEHHNLCFTGWRNM